MFIIDEFLLYFLMAIPSVFVLLLMVLLLYLAGPQGRKHLKARILRKSTLIKSYESGALDIDLAKITPEGYLKVSEEELYEIPKSSNPFMNKRFMWKGTGTSVFIADARKAVAVNPDTLTAIEVVDQVDKKELPTRIKKWADEQYVDITVSSKAKKQETEKLFLLDPRKLKHYFSKALDVGAQGVILEKRYQAGLRAAGKQYMKMLIPIIAIFGMVAIVLAIIFIGGGMM